MDRVRCAVGPFTLVVTNCTLSVPQKAMASGKVMPLNAFYGGAVPSTKMELLAIRLPDLKARYLHGLSAVGMKLRSETKGKEQPIFI